MPEEKSNTATESDLTPAPATPPTPPPVDTDELKKVTTARDTILNEKKELQKQHKAQSEELQQAKSQLLAVTQALGEGANPLEAIEKVKREAEEAAQYKAQIETVKAEAVQKLQAEHQQQVQQLNLRNQALETSLHNRAKQEALASIFSAVGGENFTDFQALMASRMNPVYELQNADEVEAGGYPRYRVSGINALDGSGFQNDAKTETLGVEDVLLEARKGRFGAVVKQTFAEYNQSQGLNFPTGKGTPARQTREVKYDQRTNTIILQSSEDTSALIKGNARY